MNYLMFLLLVFSLNTYSQNERSVLGEKQAKNELQLALSKEAQHNIISIKSLLIKDSITAINVVEPILFSVFGKENIEGQKPYETYLINNYWVISGTLPIDMIGGTFLIIIDSRTSEVLKITHGK